MPALFSYNLASDELLLTADARSGMLVCHPRPSLLAKRYAFDLLSCKVDKLRFEYSRNALTLILEGMELAAGSRLPITVMG